MRPECVCGRPDIGEKHAHGCWMHGKSLIDILITQHAYEIDQLCAPAQHSEEDHTNGCSERCVLPDDRVPCPLCEGQPHRFEPNHEGCPICGTDGTLTRRQAVRYHECELEILCK